MNRILIVILLMTIINCKENNSIKKSSETNSKSELKAENYLEENRKESNVFYSRIKLDTVKHTQDLKIENTSHQLELKLYSLNDSLIVIDTQDLKEVYHNYAIEILLRDNRDTILRKKLTKEIFKDSIDSDYYNIIALSGIGYENIRSNQIYFDVGYEIGGNFSCIPSYYYKKCDVGIFFRTNKKGEVSFGNFRNAIE
jgi:CRISPR/Cas system CMR subunit Cmr6 (Cas7 group RAMP superfamily)